MLKIATALIVFLGGFSVMVLEVVGTRYLAKDFGDSFYVWISQIGVILIALALGYSIGGLLADRFRRTIFLAVPMAVAGLFIFFIPKLAPPLVKAITSRHHGTDVLGPLGQIGPGDGQHRGVLPAVLCPGRHFAVHGAGRRRAGWTGWERPAA